MDETGEISKKKVTRRDFLKLNSAVGLGVLLSACEKKYKNETGDKISEQTEKPELTEDEIRNLIKNSKSEKGTQNLQNVIRETALQQQKDFEMLKKLPKMLLSNSVLIQTESRTGNVSVGSGFILWHGHSSQIDEEVALVLTAKHNFLGELGEADNLKISRPHLINLKINPDIGWFENKNFSHFKSPENVDLGMLVVHSPKFHDVIPAAISVSEQASNIKILSFPNGAPSYIKENNNIKIDENSPMGLVSSGILKDNLSVEGYEDLIKITNCLLGKGSSGGPVVGEQGKLTGIVSRAVFDEGFFSFRIPDEDEGYPYMQPVTVKLLERLIEGKNAEGSSVNEIYGVNINVAQTFFGNLNN